MADSDEYYEDSFELDEVALASIQATEERFGASLSKVQAITSQQDTVLLRRRSSTPPHKRFKLTQGWIGPIESHVRFRKPMHPLSPGNENINDDPEVFVGSDGNYILNGAVREYTENVTKIRGEKYENQMDEIRTVPNELGAKFEEMEVKRPKFRGFQNAFTDSAPVLTSPRKIHEADGSENVGMPVGADEKENSNKDPVTRAKMDERLGEENIMRGIDYKEELRHIVFSHIASGADTLTLQALLATPLPEELSLDKKQMFESVCQTIIETCGSKYDHPHIPADKEGENHLIHRVANACVIMGELLSDAGCIAPLVALLELMTMLVIHIPPFLSPLLLKDVVGREVAFKIPSQLLLMLEIIVRNHIALPRPPPMKNVEDWKPMNTLRIDLATVVVQLMESLYWNVKDDRQQHLEMICCRSNILENLLHTGQPPELIERTLRLLVLIATHSFSRHSLVACRDTPVANHRHLSLNETCPTTLMERLCYYIIYPPEKRCDSIQRLIITFISLLCDNHTSATNTLLNSTVLAPSLVVCITRLSRLLWEDNIELMNSYEDSKLVVETLHSSINLLHDLVISSETSINLNHQLVEVAQMSGPFNGMPHLFMVTFGRLSWAEVPEWLRDDCKGTCDIISELAMEVIETVIAGPECDSLWAVWHPDEDLDDEEAEAQKFQIQ